jgi:hypothetical protein
MAKAPDAPIRRITMQRPAAHGMTCDYILEVYDDGRVIKRWGGTREAVALLVNKKTFNFRGTHEANLKAEGMRDEKLREMKNYQVISDIEYPDAPAKAEDERQLFLTIGLLPGVQQNRWLALLAALGSPQPPTPAQAESPRRELRFGPHAKVTLDRKDDATWMLQVAAEANQRDVNSLVLLTAMAHASEVNPTDGHGQSIERSDLIDQLRARPNLPSRALLEAVGAVPANIDLAALIQRSHDPSGLFD